MGRLSTLNWITLKCSSLDNQVSIELNDSSSKRMNRTVRNRWQLLLTLHNNPSLKEHRRSELFVQKSPLAAFGVMIKKGMMPYRVDEEKEKEHESGVEDIKLWFTAMSQLRSQVTSMLKVLVINKQYVSDWPAYIRSGKAEICVFGRVRVFEREERSRKVLECLWSDLLRKKSLPQLLIYESTKCWIIGPLHLSSLDERWW